MAERHAKQDLKHDYDVVIVGAGFGGIGAAVALKRLREFAGKLLFRPHRHAVLRPT